MTIQTWVFSNAVRVLSVQVSTPWITSVTVNGVRYA